MDSTTLYLDASGDQGFPHPFGNSKTEWHVLSGITLSSESNIKANRECAKLLDEYSPISIRSNFESKYHELHYNSIYNGHDIYSHLDFPKRVELIDKIFDLICKLDPIIMSISIKKVQLCKIYPTPDNPKVLAVRSVIGKFSMYLKRKNMVGTVVYDAEEYHKDVQLRDMMNHFRWVGVERRGMSYSPLYTAKLENVLDTINLCPSEMSYGIQLADFCAKALWLSRERGNNSRFKQIQSLYEYDSIHQKKYDDTIFPHPDKWI